MECSRPNKKSIIAKTTIVKQQWLTGIWSARDQYDPHSTNHIVRRGYDSFFLQYYILDDQTAHSLDSYHILQTPTLVTQTPVG